MKQISLIAVLVGLIGPMSGQCTIIYSPGPLPPPPPLIIGARQAVDFDSDGIGEVEFSSGYTICTDDFPTSFCSTPFFVGAANRNELLISGYYSAIQSFGELIGDVPPTNVPWSGPGFQGYLTTQWWSLYGQEIDGQLVHWGWAGPLGAAGSGFIGVRFYAANGLHYGWIRVHLGFPTLVVDWAYETRPNTPILAGAGIDSDNDGVWDLSDQCPGTPAGEAVDANGCSIGQLVPCDGPWKNHGDYMNHVQSVASQFFLEGLISGSERRAIVKGAAASNCGKHR